MKIRILKAIRKRYNYGFVINPKTLEKEVLFASKKGNSTGRRPLSSFISYCLFNHISQRAWVIWCNRKSNIQSKKEHQRITNKINSVKPQS